MLRSWAVRRTQGSPWCGGCWWGGYWKSVWGWSQEHGPPLVLTRALSLVVGPSTGWGPRCDRRQRGDRCAHDPPWAGARMGDKRAQWPVRGLCRAGVCSARPGTSPHRPWAGARRLCLWRGVSRMESGVRVRTPACEPVSWRVACRCDDEDALRGSVCDLRHVTGCRGQCQESASASDPGLGGTCHLPRVTSQKGQCAKIT